MTLSSPLAIVDVETTGLSPKWDRIIEICILRVEDGRIVEKLDTLVNPETYVSPFIESITGIRKEDLESAPVFSEVREKISDILHGATFIAHNVNFDYSFIREELKRVETSYSAKTMCTVRLSRNLFPQHRSHNLSSLIERFKLECAHRHRAYDDALVLYQFLEILKKDFSKEKLEDAISITTKNSYSFDTPLSMSIEELPESAGVYIFYDKDNMPLYIGKSINIKERVKSHLTPTIGGTRDLSILNNLSRVEYIKTAGELGALFLESEKIKALQPVFNRKLRLKKKFVAAIKTMNKNGVSTIEIKIIDNFAGVDFETLYGVFKTKRSLKETLDFMVKKYGLCQKIMGLENTKTSCFEYKLGRCKGICIGKENKEKYNARFLIAYIENKQFRPWMFDGPIEIVEKNEEEGIFESFLIDKWCLLGKRVSEHEINFNKEATFDLDSYKIMSSYIKYKKAYIKRVDASMLAAS